MHFSKNSNEHKSLRSGCMLAACATLLLPVASEAFNFQNMDMVLGIRQPGGTYEMTVNLGPALNFNNLPAGKTVVITAFSKEALSLAFSDLSGIKWSVFGAHVSDSPEVPPQFTCWATRARSNPTTQSTPWVRRTAAQQSNADNSMFSIGNNAVIFGRSLPNPSVEHTDTAVVIPAGNVYSYSSLMGAAGNFNTKFFQGNIENTTPADFVTGQKSVRSDLYFLVPSDTRNLPSQYLGYFELSSGGYLTFTAAGGVNPPVDPAPPTLTISGPALDGSVVVSFPAEGNNAIYSLTATDAAGLVTSKASWPVIQGPVTNATPGTVSFEVPPSIPVRFFSVTGTRK